MNTGSHYGSGLVRGAGSVGRNGNAKLRSCRTCSGNKAVQASSLAFFFAGEADTSAWPAGKLR
jgi:hypothetical protein